MYDSSPQGASITKVHDDELSKEVIEFSGSGIQNGYILYKNEQKHKWEILSKQNYHLMQN